MTELSPTDALIAIGLLALLVFLMARRGRRSVEPLRTGDLLGPIERAELEAHPGFGLDSAQAYAAKAGVIAALAQRRDGLKLLVFVGTWCPDSVRQVPRFLAIIDQAGFQSDQLALIGLDRSKRDRAGLAERYAIERVPTIVVMQGEREFGRIVERPRGSLEQDLLGILAQADARSWPQELKEEIH